MFRAHFAIRLDGASLPASAAQSVADLDAARAVARTVVQRLMRQHGGDPRLLDATMVISDDDGVALLELAFFDALYMPVEPVADSDRRRPRPPRKAGPARLGAALRPVWRLAGALTGRGQPRLDP
jgi:hypothetical protein